MEDPKALAQSLARPVLSVGELKALLRADPSARSLALSNLLVIALALVEGWPAKTVMFIYCGQSIIIGLFNVLRILNVKEAAALQMRGVKVPAQARVFVAGFFAVHYGLFNFGYFQFIGWPQPADRGWVGVSLLAFFAHHLFSFWRSFRKEASARDLTRLMFFPYLRIIPMHITIIFGGFLMMLFRNELADRFLLVFFLLLKTGADLKAHQVEHVTREDRGPRPGRSLPEE